MTTREYKRNWARRAHGHKPQRRLDAQSKALIRSLLMAEVPQPVIASVTGWSQATVSNVNRRRK